MSEETGTVRAILTYHSIDPSGSVISVDEATFRRHAGWLADGPATAVTVDDLVAGSDDDDLIAVVFDDAFENFGSVAWPVMRDLGLPATVFVVTAETGRSNAWGGGHESGIPTLPLLDWEALGRLAEEGVEVGSHTRTHPHLDRVSAARVEDEVEGAAADIEARLGRRPRGFAYPYGDLDEGSVETVRGAHAWACTTELAPVVAEDDAHLLPRLDAFYYRRAGQLEAWGTTTFRARLGMRRAARDARAWLAARRAS